MFGRVGSDPLELELQAVVSYATRVLETELECSEQAASALNQTPLQPQGKDLCHQASPELDLSKMARKSVISKCQGPLAPTHE